MIDKLESLKTKLLEIEQLFKTGNTVNLNEFLEIADLHGKMLDMFQNALLSFALPSISGMVLNANNMEQSQALKIVKDEFFSVLNNKFELFITNEIIDFKETNKTLN